MKICIINSVFGQGSTGHIVAQLAKGFIDAGHQCHIIYSRNNTVDNETIHRFYDRFGFYHHVFNALVFDKHGLYSIKQTKAILDLLDKIKPDVVNIHNLHGFYINYPRLFEYLRKHKITIIYTLHDCWSFTGFCSHFTRFGCQEWKTGCSHCRYRDIYPYRILSNSRHNFVLKQQCYNDQMIHLVVPSQWLASMVKQSMWLDTPVSVISNDIDTAIFNTDASADDFDRSRYHLENKKIVLAVASIWTNAKGQHDLVSLAKSLPNTYQLVMIGKAKKHCESIRYIEHANAHQLAQWYRHAFCFVNCSYEDTYPTVNREALACGCPVITYDTGGCKELTNSVHNLVNVGDVEMMAKMICDNRFDRVVTPYEPSNMIQHYLELIDQMGRKAGIANG